MNPEYILFTTINMYQIWPTTNELLEDVLKGNEKPYIYTRESKYVVRAILHTKLVIFFI